MPGAIANRYAEALADAVFAPGGIPGSTPESAVDAKRAAEELRTFQSLVGSSEELRHVLLSPAVSTVKKRAVIGRLVESLRLSRLVRNFLFVMVDRRRADLLGEVAEAFEIAVDERMGFVRAEVTSAAPLSEMQKTELQTALSQLAGKQVRCDYRVDSSLIGGVVARIGSTVYDGSVRTQMESLRQRLVS